MVQLLEICPCRRRRSFNFKPFIVNLQYRVCRSLRDVTNQPKIIGPTLAQFSEHWVDFDIWISKHDISIVFSEQSNQSITQIKFIWSKCFFIFFFNHDVSYLFALCISATCITKNMMNGVTVKWFLSGYVHENKFHLYSNQSLQKRLITSIANVIFVKPNHSHPIPLVLTFIPMFRPSHLFFWIAIHSCMIDF